MANQTVNAGHTTFGDVFKKAKFDVEKEAAADYNDGKADYRRVQVGGLPFSGDPEENFYVPESATSLAVTLDGKEVVTFDVKSDDEG